MEDLTKKMSLNNLNFLLMEDKIDLRKLLYTLLAEKWLIISVTCITFILGLLYALTLVPLYQTNVLLQVEKKQGAADVGIGLFSGLNKTTSASDIHVTLIKSRFILVPVVTEMGMDIAIHPHYFPLIGKYITKQFNSSKLISSQLKHYAWQGETLDISRFNVPVSDAPFKLVADVNNTYKLYTSSGQFILKGKMGQLEYIKNSTVNGSILIKKIIAHRGAEFYISKLATENIADKLAAQIKINDLGQIYQLDKTGVLEISLIGAQPSFLVNILNSIATTAIKKDIDRKSIEAEKTLNFLNGQLKNVKTSLNVSESNLNKHHMESGVIDLNVKSKMILKQLNDVQREIEKVNLSHIMSLQQLTPLHPYVIGLKEKKMALQNELLSLEKELHRLPVTDQVTIGLMREIRVKSQLYLMLLNKMQEYQMITAGIISDIRILHPAQLPQASLPTKRLIIILASILVGLILGSLLVLFKKVFKNHIEDPNWLETHFGIPTFAIVPHSQHQKANVLAHQDKRQALLLLAKTQPRDLSIESLRSLRTSLQFALIGAKNNIISIMGISPGIGKSFISVNFAYVLAEAGKRVLLIDGDIRKGYLYSYFNNNRAPGLTEVISGELPLEKCIQKTSLSHLEFMASGKFPPNPSELLMSQQFKEILFAVSNQYDLVIIDTAPILAVTDGVIIASEASVSFLVIANGIHQAEEINIAVKRLQSNNVTIQGVIFNNLHEKNSTKGYNYHYSYGETEKSL